MRKNLFKLCVSLALALPMAVTQAEDIDLFTGNNPSSTDIPNVLFVVDNTANWNSPFTAEMGALASAFSALPVDASGAAKFRVGVMMFSQTGSPNANSQGGYVRAAIRSMDKATQAKYGALISNLNSNNDKAQGGEAGVTMAEVYRYLSGGAPVTGTSRVRADYTGNSISSGTGKNPITAGDTASNAIYALPGNALSTFAGTQYTAPASSGCAGTFVIYISNGPAQDSNGANGSPLANSLLQAAGGDTTPIVLNPSGSQDTVADEWSRFLYKNMGVRVFTLDVLPGTTGQGPGWSALLQSMANVSNGTYFP
ncbi:hypothetical protein ACQ858_15340 [Variovorax ureilyticus]|uniref:hypothetical protein n=1 Tax=Variovorax ureilyticus TaxID=1836198 RepID=UPI003D67955E